MLRIVTTTITTRMRGDSIESGLDHQLNIEGEDGFPVEVILAAALNGVRSAEKALQNEETVNDAVKNAERR